MANLYITEQNSVLRKTGERLRVHKEDQVLLDKQCHKLDAVMIFGNVQFTTQAVHEMMAHGIELAILTRNGRLVGQLTSPATKNIALRVKQFRQYDNEGFCLDYARTLVAAKIANSLGVVKAFYRNHTEAELGGAVRELRHQQETALTGVSIESLRGIEGSAARTYFSALSRMIRTDLPFEGRRKRPPTDPVNALLSLGYTMLFNEISSLLDGLGFDPYLGYLHAVDYGRASLAADLMEPFRAPVVDRFTLNLLNLGILKEEDFKTQSRGGAVQLRRAGLQRYFTEYENHLTHPFDNVGFGAGVNFRKCFRIQAERLAAALIQEVPFQPFKVE